MTVVADLVSIDINSIVDLGTQVGTSGAIRAGQVLADEIFQLIVGIAELVYEINPG